jgi:hypothetical protein
MSLADLIVHTATIHVGEQSFEVRGLSVSDLSVLASKHLTELKNIFEGADGGKEFDLQGLILKAPKFAATIIALAADDLANASKVEKLPAGVQVVALKAIWDLSVVEKDELVKIWGDLSAEIEAIPSPAQALKATSGASKKL